MFSLASRSWTSDDSRDGEVAAGAGRCGGRTGRRNRLRHSIGMIDDLPPHGPGAVREKQMGAPARSETDSWFLVEMGGHRLLNLDDYVPGAVALHGITRVVGPIDVLLTQFLYEATGNKLAELKSRSPLCDRCLSCLAPVSCGFDERRSQSNRTGCPGCRGFGRHPGRALSGGYVAGGC
jgi:hypothetical protein